MDWTVVGHKAQRGLLRELASTGKLPPSMLFTGISGIGKRLVAHELASFLLCEERNPKVPGGCGLCSACTLFRAGNHPDFYFINCAEREEGSITRIRDLLSLLHLRPYRGRARVVIFDSAEAMSTQSANVLLKSFEEPRDGTFFVLVSASPHRLPQTLLSRCQSWIFDRLSDREVEDVISLRRRLGDDPELPNDPDVLMLFDGSMENAETISTSLEEWRELSRRLDLIAKGDSEQAMTLSSELSKERDELRSRLRLVRIYARHRLLKCTDDSSFSRWSLLLSNSLSADRLIFERNLNSSLVLLNLFIPLLPETVLDSFTRLTNSGNLLERFF